MVMKQILYRTSGSYASLLMHNGVCRDVFCSSSRRVVAGDVSVPKSQAAAPVVECDAAFSMLCPQEAAIAFCCAHWPFLVLIQPVWSQWCTYCSSC